MLKYVMLGVSIGLGLTTALSMVATGYRVDEEGTGPTQAETILGWGGLAVAFLLFVGSIVRIQLSQARLTSSA